MTTRRYALGAFLLLATAACKSTEPVRERDRSGEWAIHSVQTASLRRAIVTQRTLYPYHFEPGTADLNSLGERDLAMLTEHFRAAPGELNVRRGDASQPLYDARVAAVVARLESSGIATDHVAVKDGLPGGAGLSSERVVAILKKEMSRGASQQQSLIQGSGSSSSAASTGSSVVP